MNSFWMVRLGSLVAGGGIVWAVYIATQDPETAIDFGISGLRTIFLRSGPMEVCAIGILMWLAGKWRGAVLER